jgi:hypothetical protein
MCLDRHIGGRQPGLALVAMSEDAARRSDPSEWDLLLGLVLQQLADARRARGEEDWVSVAALERAMRELGAGAADAVREGWALDATQREIVERRVLDGREQVRLGSATPVPPELASSPPERRRRGLWRLLRR